jgi:hypothetical protein
MRYFKAKDTKSVSNGGPLESNPIKMKFLDKEDPDNRANGKVLHNSAELIEILDELSPFTAAFMADETNGLASRRSSW